MSSPAFWLLHVTIKNSYKIPLCAKLKYNVLQVWGFSGQYKDIGYVVPNELNIKSTAFVVLAMKKLSELLPVVNLMST